MDLPPEAASSSKGTTAGSADKDRLSALYAKTEQALHSLLGRTDIGGYAELKYGYNHQVGLSGGQARVDLSRMVVFLSHNFADNLRFYSELEVEHAVSSADDPGEVEIEQCYVDWDLWGDALALRVGLSLIPMGIINQHHEPTSFNGVDRPAVSTMIIPSTWREPGIGIHGTLLPGLRYQLDLIDGFNALGFDTTRGVHEGHQEAALARANGLAGVAHLEYEPLLGTVIGASVYYGEAGANAGKLFDAVGDPLHLTVPVLGLSADARWRWHGLEVRAVVASFRIGNTPQLRGAHDAAGDLVGPDVAAQQLGAYGELAYNVLALTHCTQALTAFARYEWVDPVASIKGRPRSAADNGKRFTDLVMGVSYHPIREVVFKADVLLRRPGGGALGTNLYQLGLGLLY